jgi:hypothetical protein
VSIMSPYNPSLPATPEGLFLLFSFVVWFDLSCHVEAVEKLKIENSALC